MTCDLCYDFLYYDVSYCLGAIVFVITFISVLSYFLALRQHKYKLIKDKQDAFRQYLQPFLYYAAKSMYDDLIYPGKEAKINRTELKLMAMRVKNIIPNISDKMLALADCVDDEKAIKIRDEIDAAILGAFMAGEEKDIDGR